ncbi:MAG: TfoX/Sxy family protein [Clostridiales bacterium]|jgi:predicted flap endonuclease-1-like 5' DNA nuclease|nr:TfoX/Sxy family protein [Clostridiales bacterium]
MGELEKLPNIGKEMVRQLNEIGVTTPEQLRAMGSKQAWSNIKDVFKEAKQSATKTVVKTMRKKR